MNPPKKHKIPAFNVKTGLLHSPHARKALWITVFIELFLIMLLAKMHFPPAKKEQLFEVQTQPDDFDFSQLPKPKHEKLPDITPYLNQPVRTLASNELAEDFSDQEEQRNQSSEESADTQDEPVEKQGIADSLPKPEPKIDNKDRDDKTGKTFKEEKSFKGISRIVYAVPWHFKTHLRNPLYTCPDDMHGWVVIKIIVNRNGDVLKAEYDPGKSTTDKRCLIESALRYSRDTHFNSNPRAPEKVIGYIKYLF